MSRNSWAADYYNSEEVLFKKGHWTFKQDKDKDRFLYFDDACIDPMCDYDEFRLFDKGFILYRKNEQQNAYALFQEDIKTPLYKLKGKDVYVKKEENLISFVDGTNITTFDINSMSKVTLDDENQIKIDF